MSTGARTGDDVTATAFLCGLDRVFDATVDVTVIAVISAPVITHAPDSRVCTSWSSWSCLPKVVVHRSGLGLLAQHVWASMSRSCHDVSRLLPSCYTYDQFLHESVREKWWEAESISGSMSDVAVESRECFWLLEVLQRAEKFSIVRAKEGGKRSTSNSKALHEEDFTQSSTVSVLLKCAPWLIDYGWTALASITEFPFFSFSDSRVFMI